MMLLLACGSPSIPLREDTAEVERCRPIPEVCNTRDDDCDGLVDDEDADVTGTQTWWSDDDGDGFGDADDATTMACAPGDGWSENNDDCDDESAAISPGSTEVCNDIDDDCDWLVDGKDDSLADGLPWYLDRDEDGYGDDREAEVACSAPPGRVETGGDCDDFHAGRHPDATETCDGEDEDCDGVVDDACGA